MGHLGQYIDTLKLILFTISYYYVNMYTLHIHDDVLHTFQIRCIMD